MTSGLSACGGVTINGRLKALSMCTLLSWLLPVAAFGAPTRIVPPLPAPTGTVVNVSTEPQLRAAFGSLASNTTIVIAPGTYNLSGALYINGTFTNITVRGATNNSDDVVLAGRGMTDATVPYGLWLGGNVQGATIANLTIRDIFYHPIMLNAGVQSPRMYNLHLINAGQQFVKSNPNGSGGGVDNGVVEYSVFEYVTTAKDSYTNAVDVHTGRNWTVRYNLFRNIRAPQGQLAGPAILMWNGSSGTIAEGNTFINCHREISFGLIARSPYDHSGGVIRNNFIYRPAGAGGDVAIFLGDSPNTQVLHNTIFLSGAYASPIEYRFPNTTGVSIVNNLLDGNIQARDGAAGSVTGNSTAASTALFVDTASGDLHLRSTAAVAIDRGVSAANCPLDWDGTTRPLGAARDIGADEFGSTQAVPPTAPTNLRIVQ